MELSWLTLTILVLARVSSPAPVEDEITDLPGLGYTLPFKHYSGYLTASEGKQLHYWFTESSNNPAEDPVVIWMNGGPGCSSLLGLFTEHGPYLINSDGKTLRENVYAWNTIANVLYLEAPACVGYSYDVNGNCTTNDDQTALSNYNAVKDFFTTKFPEYRENEFFITGESYGGIYVPTLTVNVIEGLDDFPLNIQGFAIANGMTSWEISDNANIFFGYFHGLYGDNLWDRLVTNCCEGGIATKDTCNFFYPTTEDCNKASQEAHSIIYGGNLNTYNLYAQCKFAPELLLSRYMADLRGLNKTYAFDLNKLMEDRRSKGEVKTTPPCLDYTALLQYLNTPEFRQAAHIHEGLPDWDVCSDSIDYHQQYITMKEKYEYLIPRTRALVFAGDVDMACNFLGSEWFVESLDLEVVEERRMWFEEEGTIVGGFVKRFRNLDYMTVLGAGHMVPEDRPAAALKLITNFIENRPY